MQTGTWRRRFPAAWISSPGPILSSRLGRRIMPPAELPLPEKGGDENEQNPDLNHESRHGSCAAAKPHEAALHAEAVRRFSAFFPRA